MIEAMRFGRIEIAYFGPLSYVLAKIEAPTSSLSLSRTKGSPPTEAIIITKPTVPSKRSKTSREKTVGFGRSGLDVEPSHSARLSRPA